jgi:hypothetical protein
MRDYYLLIDGQQVGPYTAEQLHEMLAKGELTNESPAWYDGLPDWAQLGSILEELAPPVQIEVAPIPVKRVVTAPIAATATPAVALTSIPYTGVVQTNVKQGALLGGLVCFLLGMGFMYFSLFSFIFYGPLFLVALILSVVAMAQGRVAGGVILLLVNLVVPTIFGLILFSERASNALASVAAATPAQAAPANIADSTLPMSTTTRMDTASTPASSSTTTPTSSLTNTSPVVMPQPSPPKVADPETAALVTNAAPISSTQLEKAPDTDSAVATTTDTTSNNASSTSATNAAPAAAPEAPAIANATQTPAPNQISEAFGMKLGDIFDPANATGTGTLTNGTPEYDITPVSPFRSFTDYYILITPLTHKIYAIEAQGNFDNSDMAKKEQAVIMQLLTDKYGPVADQEPDEIMDNGQHISQGHRLVLTSVKGFTTATLLIQYIDTDLAGLAEKERIKTEAKKVDAGGL